MAAVGPREDGGLIVQGAAQTTSENLFTVPPRSTWKCHPEAHPACSLPHCMHLVLETEQPVSSTECIPVSMSKTQSPREALGSAEGCSKDSYKILFSGVGTYKAGTRRPAFFQSSAPKHGMAVVDMA